MRTLLVLLFSVVFFFRIGHAAESIQVGVASAPINPEAGVFLGGYDHNRRSTGVHDDLFCKAIVFDDGESLVALVVLDALSVQYPMTQAIRKAAVEQATCPRLDPANILVQATHTHCAPDTIGIYGASQYQCGRNPKYMKALVNTTAKTIAQAIAERQEASLRWSKTVCSGWAVNDSEPDILDNSVTIIQCLDKDGASLATLTNFACHPTVLDGETTESSADWVGYFYQAMAKATPGEHLFLQGSVGAWIQPKTPERSFSLARQYGEDLASKVIFALTETKPFKASPVRIQQQKIEIPVKNPIFMAMSVMGLADRDFVGESVASEVAWFAVGEAQFATHPAESAPEYTFQTRALMDTQGPKCVLGLGLDHLGYFCPKRYHEEPATIPYAPYLISMSPGPESGPVMMQALEAIIP